MKKLCWLIGLATTIVGCAAVPTDPTVGQSVLAEAKSRAQKYCATVKDGCEYILSTNSNGWSVLVAPVRFAPNGQRIKEFDTDDMYFYNRKGQFTGALYGY